MFKPTDEQMEEWFKPAFEDINMILDEVNRETNCGNEYLIHMLKSITDTYVGVQKVLDEEGIEN
tara:strand:- start:352 stop:543 length:192 start_codon:yes stop_codon:yes gene_type:complete